MDKSLISKNKMPTLFQKKNRGGWIQIVEAFVSVLLVAGVLLIVFNKVGFQKADISNKVYEAQVSILREVETNDSLRLVITNAPEPMPVEWNDTRFPVPLKDKITSRTPNYLNCIGKICNMTQICSLSQGVEKDIYSEAVTITSTLQNLTYRKLNLFCWAK